MQERNRVLEEAQRTYEAVRVRLDQAAQVGSFVSILRRLLACQVCCVHIAGWSRAGLVLGLCRVLAYQVSCGHVAGPGSTGG